MAQRLRSDARGEPAGRDMAAELRAIALSIQGYSQMTVQIVQRMGQYLRLPEQQLPIQSRPTLQARGWNSGVGSGFGVAEILVNEFSTRRRATEHRLSR